MDRGCCATAEGSCSTQKTLGPGEHRAQPAERACWDPFPGCHPDVYTAGFVPWHQGLPAMFPSWPGTQHTPTPVWLPSSLAACCLLLCNPAGSLYFPPVCTTSAVISEISRALQGWVFKLVVLPDILGEFGSRVSTSQGSEGRGQ